MSPLWFLGFFIPLLNVITIIVVTFRIAKARGKSVFVGFLFLLPITSFFAFLYLAFSEGVQKPGPARARIPMVKFGAA